MKSNEYSGTHQAGKIYDEEAVYDGDDVLSGGTGAHMCMSERAI
jgi:hypothetical protein